MNDYWGRTSLHNEEFTIDTWRGHRAQHEFWMRQWWIQQRHNNIHIGSRTNSACYGSGLRRFLIRARPPGQLLAIDRTNLHGPLFLPYLFCRFPLISGNQSIQAGASFREFRPHTLTHWRIWAPRADAALCSLRGHHNPILFYRSI